MTLRFEVHCGQYKAKGTGRMGAKGAAEPHSSEEHASLVEALLQGMLPL